MDPFVKKLISNRFYNIGNRYLPGDISPFAPLKRIGANIYLQCDAQKNLTVHRFYPVRPLTMCETKEEYQKQIDEAYSILNKNIELATKK